MYCYHCMKTIEEGAQFCPHCGQSTQDASAPHHLLPGTILNAKYFVGNVIGEGGFGITYVGLDLTLQLKIAVKEFYPNGYANRNHEASQRVTLNYQKAGEYFKNGKERFLQEAQSLAKFSREPGIVNVRDFFTENETAYIIMDFIEGVTLAKKLENGAVFRAEDTFRVMLPVMAVLDKMHAAQIVHRDISPDNMMLAADGSITLMDFGSARYFTGAEKKTMSVQYKPGYAPYEQYDSEGNQGPWTDVYGLCATMYRCITGQAPADSLNRVSRDGLKKPSELGVRIPAALENVLMYGLAVFPEQRCRSMQELMTLTEKALRSEPVAVPQQNPGAVVGRAMAEDGRYRTMFADSTYGDSRDYSRATPDNYNNSYRGGYPAQPRKKSAAGWIIALVAGILLVCALIGVILFFVLNRGGSGETDETVPATTVQTEPQTTVEATTSQETVEVPNVCGKKLDDAVRQLEELSLKTDSQTVESKEVPAGYVVKQSIDPGRPLNKGDTVLLFVAKEPETTAPAPVVTEAEPEDVVLYCCASDFATLRDRASRTGTELVKIPSRGAATYISSTGDFYYVNYRGQKGYVLKEFFSQDKNAPLNYGSGNSGLQKNDTLYCCASDFATLRRSASRDAAEITKIGSREEVTYLGSQGDFYQVSYGSQTGYVLKEYFATSPDAPLNYGDN